MPSYYRGWGYILSFRRGGGRVYEDQALVRFPGVDDSRKAHSLLNKMVIWDNGSTRIRGVIKRVHGRKGIVVVKFRRALPGQAVGTRVFLIG